MHGSRFISLIVLPHPNLSSCCLQQHNHAISFDYSMHASSEPYKLIIQDIRSAQEIDYSNGLVPSGCVCTSVSSSPCMATQYDYTSTATQCTRSATSKLLDCIKPQQQLGHKNAWQSTGDYFSNPATAPSQIKLRLLRLRQFESVTGRSHHSSDIGYCDYFSSVEKLCDPQLRHSAIHQ